jgi:hypothetical protein
MYSHPKRSVKTLDIRKSHPKESHSKFSVTKVMTWVHLNQDRDNWPAIFGIFIFQKAGEVTE